MIRVLLGGWNDVNIKPIISVLKFMSFQGALCHTLKPKVIDTREVGVQGRILAD